jgi:hypothetical protein
MQLFINEEEQKFETSSNPADYEPNYFEIGLENGHATTVVATYTLVNDEPPIVGELGNLARHNKAILKEAESDLGIADGSVEMTDRLWTACVPPNYSAIQTREFCALARCVE